MNTQNQPLPNKFAEIRFDQFKNMDFTQYAAKYVYIYLCCIFLVVVIYIAYTDKNAATTNYYYYLAFIVIPILIAFYVISPLFTQPLGTEQSIIIGTWGLAILIAAFVFFKNRSSSNVNLANQGLKIVFAIGVIVALSIVYKILARSINNMKGWFGFFLQFIFFLPCMFLYFVEYVLGDLASTPRVVMVLFVIQLLILLAYYYLPNILKDINGISDTSRVLVEPIFINKETVIADNGRLVIRPTRNDIPKSGDDSVKVFSMNYTIIAWINITPHPSNNLAYSRETNILKYGRHNRKYGKPGIVYNGSGKDGANQNILVYLSDNSIPATERSKIGIEIEGQKWNQIAVVYDNNEVCVYLNGEFVKKQALGPGEIPKYYESDLLIAGSGTTRNPTGLHGAICNVSYYDTPLTKDKIAMMYNLYALKNPPY